MRIAVWHNLPSGGGKRALYDHVKGLTDRGHYVESWRPPLFDDDYLPLSNLIKETVTPLSLNSFKPKTRFGRAVAPYRDLRITSTRWTNTVFVAPMKLTEANSKFCSPVSVTILELPRSPSS